MTELEKNIYNTHLRISRTIQNKPYKNRVDFESLEDEKKLLVGKLGRFFSSNPSVKLDDYFKAPHKVYPDESHYPLEFYITAKAKKCYSLYIKTMELSDPDSSENLKKLQQSLLFVYKYCQENGINMEDYQEYTPETLPIFIEHLKHHDINFYTLHALTFQKISVESGILDFIFGDFYITFQKTKNKFFASTKMKEFAKKAKQILITKQKIENNNNE